MQPLLIHLPHAAHLGSKQTTHLGVTVLLSEFSGFLSAGDSPILLHVGITWEPNESPPQAN